MKRIGIIGGMSWESTVTYYQLMNREIQRRFGGYHSADIVLRSVDFAPIEELQRAGNWRTAGAELAAVARECVAAGAELLVLATNTMHLVFDAIEGAVTVPVIHIADATAEAARRRGLSTLGLLGTSFTMEQPFYRERLETSGGLSVILPEAGDRREIHRIIFDELVVGSVRAESREVYRGVMERLAQAGAEGIILGCTEIGLLVGPEEAPTRGAHRIPLLDTSELHALAAVEAALG
ncbi:MAG: aspartate/glutamate racemase family protein [Spirochaetota bacterium]